jgi:eukaryotic-like serine/threonine-protein kinase
MSESNSQILFDKFEILECFKKDSFAGVYLANHIYLNKKIIVKVLNVESGLDSTVLDRFKREAKTLAKLDHKNIINVLDLGVQDSSFYISFDYFESKNLREIIINNNLSINDKKHLLVQLFEGLDFAHKNHIIHRDIKPENILVNKNLELKISDFGLALGINDNFLTSQNSIVGTPCYMSPEQILGSELDTTSDLFSAGIIAYELFAGKNLFLGSDVNATLNNIINYNEDNESIDNLRIDSDVLFVIKNLLKKNASDRFKSASEALFVLLPDSLIKTETQTSSQKKYYSITLLSMAILIIAVVLWKTTLISSSNKNEAVKPTIKQTNNSPLDYSLDTVKNSHYSNDMIVSDFRNNDGFEKESNSSLKEEIQLVNTSNGFGFIYIECKPWAEIYIDDTFLDVSPIKENITVSPGNHNLKLKHPGYPVANISVSISDKKTESIKVNLDTLFAFIDFNILPWGDIYMNGKYIGQTPLQSLAKVFPGYQNIVIKNPDYPEYQTKVFAMNKDTLLVRHKF